MVSPPRCSRILLPLLLLVLVTAATSAAAGNVLARQNVTFEQYRLPNGLRVVLAPDHSVPVTAVCVTYDVGSRNEKAGRAGFAHLFEHLMFEGSAHVQAGQHLRLIQWAGGYANGGTNTDVTHYYEAFPREQLKLALFLEADRMTTLRLTQETFVKARGIVEAEKRERHDATAYDPVPTALQQMAFTKFANAHATIGTVDNLESATLEDARRFYATYYAPRNAVLAIAGDFDPSKAKAMISAYFAAGKNRLSANPPVVDDTEPLNQPIPSRMRWASLNLKRSALPRYYLSFRIPPMTHPDYPALVMLSDILGDGRGSRCWRGLVESGYAVSESVICRGRRGASLFEFSAQAADRHTNFQKIANGFAVEIQRIRQQGVSEKELIRVRNEEHMSTVNDRMTALARCRLLADNAVSAQDPARTNSFPALLQAVTASDIMRVARKYLTDTNHVELFAR